MTRFVAGALLVAVALLLAGLVLASVRDNATALHEELGGWGTAVLLLGTPIVIGALYAFWGLVALVGVGFEIGQWAARATWARLRRAEPPECPFSELRPWRWRM